MTSRRRTDDRSRDAWALGLPADVRLLLLDRDGVLNRNLDGGVRDVTDWSWLPGAVRALRLLTAGRRVMIVTNQANIGRGIVSVEDLERIHRHMLHEAGAPNLTPADVLYCPHTVEHGCSCRKPRPGLLLRAMNMAGETAERTLLVGDHVSDLQAAAAAGCRCVHLRCGRGAVPAAPPPGYLGSWPDLLTLATAFPVARVG